MGMFPPSMTHKNDFHDMKSVYMYLNRMTYLINPITSGVVNMFMTSECGIK